MIRQEGNTVGDATKTMVALAMEKNFDAEKFKVMSEFQQNMVKEQARVNFVEDFFALAPMLPTIDQNGTIVIEDKVTKKVIQSTPYAKFNDIMEVIEPILHAHNFTINFITSNELDGRPKAKAILSNRRGGHEITSELAGPIEASGSKNNMQGIGSSVAYLKRYNLVAILNIKSKAKQDRDDDGQAAGGILLQPIDDDQFRKLQQLIDETGADVPKLCAMLGVTGTKLILRKDYDTAIRMLSMKSKKKAG